MLSRAELIGRHEATEVGGIVPSFEVIQAGFAIAFFAGEFVGKKRLLV
jgi:hypothetical protein